MNESIITENNIEEFASKLGDQFYFDQVVFLIDFVTESSSTGESYRLLQKLERAVNKSTLQPEFAQKYQNLILRLKYVALPMLETAEIVELFKTNFLYAFQNDIDLKDRVARLMPAYKSSREDLGVKNELAQALDSNQQRIGSNSVSNWIREYNKTVGKTTPGSLEVIQFVTDNKSAAQLDESSKDLLKSSLAFYNWLRYQSVDVNQALGLKTPKRIQPPAPRSSFEQAAFIKPNQPKPELVKERTAFEKRLAEVTAAQETAKHGEDLEALKRRMEGAQAKKPSSDAWAKELKREVETKELSGQVTQPIVAPKPKPVVAPKPVPKPVEVKQIVITKPTPPPEPPPKPAPPKPILPGVELTDIKVIDDLRKIELNDLRKGSLESQIEVIKTKILSLAKVNNILPFYAVSIFEQSPLFQEYLQMGAKKMGDASAQTDLTHEEFEAIADLKKLLGS